ncbi:MAG TPA: O-antigen ligase family protein, partial [Acidimicrobiales bacterium]|nr:O-antigen ligase family protein [Acidimicrobiales bacterium]
HDAFAQAGGDRLGGAIWPVPPTQVAHYAAVLAGTTTVLWFAGLLRARSAAVIVVVSMVLLLLSHTRTALIAFLVAVMVAGLSLFLSRRRVRKALLVTVVVGGLVALSFAPFLTSWFNRGENGHLTELSGRANVWTQLVAQPRTEVNTVFGYGMSNDSYQGLPIDSSWYATYLDQGLFGDVVDGAVLLLLLLIALFSPRGPRRAVAIFLVVYCFIASFTETGLGEASPYLLDLAVAMSVLMTPVTVDPVGDEGPSADEETADRAELVASLPDRTISG